MSAEQQPEIPLQPVERPIICSPCHEPAEHWQYDRQTGAAYHAAGRRPAGYWYETDRVGSQRGRRC